MSQQPPEPIRILAPHAARRGLLEEMTRRRALALGASGAMAAFLSACGGSTGSSGGSGGGAAAEEETPASTLGADAKVEAGPLLLANWVDYTDPENYKKYTSAVGPKVTVDGYGSNDELLAKLSAGGAKFDLVAPTGYAVKTMIDQDLAMPLDRALIPNIANIEDTFTKSEFDPGNKFSVPKDYGVTSFFWRTDVVKENPTSLAECFELLKKYKDARVNFLEGSTQTFALALPALGFSLNSEDPAEIEKAKQLLVSIKPYVDTINSTFIPRGQKGDIDFGMGWNGDVARIQESRNKVDDEVVFLLPDGPTEVWVDNWVIPSASENPVAAHKFINLMLDPEYAARETEYHQYPVPVKGVQDIADKAITGNETIYVAQEKLAKYETQLQTPKGQQLRDRAYTEFKAA